MKKRNRDYTVPRHTNDSPIAQARIAKGMTQQQLAEAIGVLQQPIGAWESARAQALQAGIRARPTPEVTMAEREEK